MIIVENVIVLGHHRIINQVQNDVDHLQMMINIVLHIHHLKMEIVKDINYDTIQFDKQTFLCFTLICLFEIRKYIYID